MSLNTDLLISVVSWLGTVGLIVAIIAHAFHWAAREKLDCSLQTIGAGMARARLGCREGL